MKVRSISSKTEAGPVHCPICTHTVESLIVSTPRHSFVKPGQKCPRCQSSLDAAYVLSYGRAA
jgi:uncharacterized protein (UPF0212 family)